MVNNTSMEVENKLIIHKSFDRYKMAGMTLNACDTCVDYLTNNIIFFVFFF